MVHLNKSECYHHNQTKIYACEKIGVNIAFALCVVSSASLCKVVLWWCFKVCVHVFSVAALKQVLVTQLMAQDEGERLGRSAGSRLLRTTSLRTPVEHNSTRTPSRAQDYTSGDTGFYECPEDYGECFTSSGLSSYNITL